ALHLDRGIGRNAAVDGGEAIAALDPPAIALRVEARGEMVAGKREAVGRHPVIGEGERRGEIGRPRARRAVDARLERVALSAAEARRQAPPGATAGKREADDAVGRETIVEAAGKACGGGGEIMAAHDDRIAWGAVAAAIGAAPRAPALVGARRRGRLLRGIPRGRGREYYRQRRVSQGRAT